jgi:hypothetical protein
MTPEERSRALRQEADEVLDLIGLHEVCAPIGKLAPTGSYLLDLMMYPDIDLYLPPTTPEKLLGVAVEVAKHDCIQRINYIRGGPGDLKDGLYLKPVVIHGRWERPWKIDIWSLASSVVEKKQAELNDLRTRMTLQQRAVILDVKYRLLTDDGRTPMFSGIHIYRAVIDNGLEQLDDIVTVLRDNGIEV